MKKTINFVEKKELIIVTILTFLIAITGLFATYAIDTKLGYNGTTYNSSYIDKTYARIDTSSTPGYFTKK